jgi:hypothetical protein
MTLKRAKPDRKHAGNANALRVHLRTTKTVMIFWLFTKGNPITYWQASNSTEITAATDELPPSPITFIQRQVVGLVGQLKSTNH